MSALASHRDFLSSIRDKQNARKAVLHSISSRPSPIASTSKDLIPNYVKEEETIRNDYTGWYNVSGRSGADYILGANDEEICVEYPALRRLMDLKQTLIEQCSHPPLYAQLRSFTGTDMQSSLSPSRFDVILIKPTGDWEETASLPIRNISADPGFVFLWVGRGDQEGLERGRECLAKWGYRRAEDIIWIKTTKKGNDTHDGSKELEKDMKSTFGRGGLLASQKEHCLMGIRGTVRRSTDNWFVHCNVDTDVLIWTEEEGVDKPDFPPYLYTLIESFCLGTRRLQLFTGPKSVRRGWVTASPQEMPANIRPYSSMDYASFLPEKQDGRDVLPYIHEIETLRPKSPVKGSRKGQTTGQRPTLAPHPSLQSQGHIVRPTSTEAPRRSSRGPTSSGQTGPVGTQYSPHHYQPAFPPSVTVNTASESSGLTSSDIFGPQHAQSAYSAYPGLISPMPTGNFDREYYWRYRQRQEQGMTQLAAQLNGTPPLHAMYHPHADPGPYNQQ